ncbi:secondary thiamine-phosphate synthase enzyme YjbQ [uncultured Microbulbifer sp.]|uniref:secondary thiamine-phosphate synthase enzyme YjbQ n=1 Tax=uncultured Microbulbifer sp. TaxID=348147 RepID=UPI002633E0DE|nr:secondary thiamine-phosphate synthase enzyme YjbQ [uncultured Microbulbifer sp.]
MAIGKIAVRVHGQGLYEFTRQVAGWLALQEVDEGLCTLFIQHTSASLLIQENADPSAREDLEAWLNRLVPERGGLYTHTQEGPDDMPAHIKSALTAASLSIPVQGGRLMLGTWQGIYLWEHRHKHGQRRIILHL